MPTLCNPTDCSPTGSSVHGIFQARGVEWGAISFNWGKWVLSMDTRSSGRRYLQEQDYHWNLRTPSHKRLINWKRKNSDLKVKKCKGHWHDQISSLTSTNSGWKTSCTPGNDCTSHHFCAWSCWELTTWVYSQGNSSIQAKGHPIECKACFLNLSKI